MKKKSSPRKDFLQTAKNIVDIATGQKPKVVPKKKLKSKNIKP